MNGMEVFQTLICIPKIYDFLGVFAKLRKANISLVMSVRLYARPFA